MLPLPSFSYEAPRSLAEALRCLSEPGALVLGGGTDLLPSLKHRLFTPSCLVSLKCITDLKEVSTLSDGSLAIGAGMTLRDVSRHPAVKESYPALVDACRTVATPTIQAMATIGGNILLDTRCLYYNQPAGWRAALGYCLKREGQVCHVAPKGKGCYAAHSSDTVPALWLMGATLEVVSHERTRLVPLRSFYENDGIRWHGLQAGEILSRIILPPAEGPLAHRKLRTRAAIDYGLLLVAAKKEKEGYRAVVSAVGPCPLEFVGETPEELAERAFQGSFPMMTHAPSPAWRKKMVRVEVRRAAEALLQG